MGKTAGEMLDQLWPRVTAYIKQIDPKRGVRFDTFASWLFWESMEIETGWDGGAGAMLAKLAKMRLKHEGLIQTRQGRFGPVLVPMTGGTAG